jgi:hypothetical protein
MDKRNSGERTVKTETHDIYNVSFNNNKNNENNEKLHDDGSPSAGCKYGIHRLWRK